MKRTEPTLTLTAHRDGRVALSAADKLVRTMPPKHARDLADLLLEVAEHADEHRIARLTLPRQRNRPTAYALDDTGLVRLSLGSGFVDVPAAEALRVADRIADAVDVLEGRAQPAPVEDVLDEHHLAPVAEATLDPQGLTAAFTRLAEAGK